MSYMHCYRDREDLTKLEKAAISHYRDLTYPQMKWKWDNNRKKPRSDYYMVNNIMRDKIKRDDLTREDKFRASWIINRVTSAINKSPVTQTFDVIRGVEMFDELRTAKVGSTIRDFAFTSFTTLPDIAAKYSRKNDTDEWIVLHLTLTPQDFALYIDAEEEEWLLAGYKKFRVKHIEHRDDTPWNSGDKAIVYYLTLTT